jgi:glutamate formiminotransferase/formiminotetrahydrofolate cyclodeaminase
LGEESNLETKTWEVSFKMPAALVECIPNFSEARRAEVVEKIVAAVKEVRGVHVLDRHSDLDHNRTVLTFVGPPAAVEEAAFQAIQTAAELINLDEHQGEHPRLGATDVVPFVPISGISMAECVEMARRLGERVGEELQIPVYLYEQAATRPERQNLENIRRGQYEALKEEIASNPAREPDFGPRRVGLAGATVIGARQPLIAYNVYLTTSDDSIAKKIAKTVRNSSGGLRYVKGLGLLVEGQAQVSMNLTNFHGTPLPQVVEMIRREAQRYGVGVHHSELVGLIPQQALVEAARWYLQLDQFEPDQILETRLAEAAQETSPEAAREVFLDALASDTPTPGGGAAAAYTSAQGAALVAMVARLTIGRKKYAAVDEEMRELLVRTETLRNLLAGAVERDMQSFNAVMAAFRLPKNTPEEQQTRSQAVEEATLGAAHVPLEVAEHSVEVMKLALQAVRLGNLNAISDGASAAAFAHAGLKSAAYNVRINISSLQDAGESKSLIDEVHALERQADVLEDQVREALYERGGLLR